MTNLTQLVLLCLSCHASQTYNLRRRLALESTDATYEVGQAVYIQVGSIFMKSVVLRSMNTNTGKIIAVCPRSTAENPRGTVEYHLPTGEIKEETLGMGSNRLRSCSKYEYFASTLRRAIPVKEELVEALKRGLDELDQKVRDANDYGRDGLGSPSGPTHPLTPSEEEVNKRLRCFLREQHTNEQRYLSDLRKEEKLCWNDGLGHCEEYPKCDHKRRLSKPHQCRLRHEWIVLSRQ